MRLSYEQAQRLASIVLIVCLVTFVGLQALRGARAVAHHFGHHEEHHDPDPDFDLDAELEAELAGLDAEVDAAVAEAMAEAEVAEAVAAGIAGATAFQASARDEVLYEQAFPVRPGDRLAVTLSSEDLVVETAAGEASVTVLGRGRDARDAFPRRRFSAEYAAGVLRVQTDPERGPHPPGQRASYTVVVRVPARLAVELRLASGDVRLGDLAGDLVLETASGDAALGRISDAAEIRVNAASGDVQAVLLDGAEVRVETASGDVRVERLAANTATVHTASGDVLLSAAGAERFEAHTASGDVAVEQLDAGAVTVNTASGDVALGLMRPAAVEVSTGSGDVGLGLPRAGFDVALDGPSIEIADDLGFEGERARRSARGRLGGGGPRLAVSTGSGEIALVRR
jgi:hypothetical protein